MEWISVKERLPENTGVAPEVIVHTKTGEVTVGWFDKTDREWWILSEDIDYGEMCVSFDSVTHWMPLPEPPMDGR